MSETLVAGALVHLFDAAVRFTSESPEDAAVGLEKREGEYLGSGASTCPVDTTPIGALGKSRWTEWRLFLGRRR